VYKTRKQVLPSKPPLSVKETPLSGKETGLPIPETPQSKVKKSKVNKESIKKEIENFEDYKKELRQRFADLDFDAELEKFNLYWTEGGRTLKRPKLALLNWMTIAERHRKEGFGGKAGQGSTGNPKRGGFATLPTHYTTPEEFDRRRGATPELPT
jgi:hypothetical protein